MSTNIFQPHNRTFLWCLDQLCCMRFGVRISVVFLALFSVESSQAAVVLTNAITGTNPNTSNPYTAGQVVDANVTASGIGRGSGITGSNANNRYNASNWNTSSLDSTDYFTFTITVASGYEIDFDEFVYTGQASGTGPTSFSFRSSLDGFASSIGVANAAGTTLSLTGVSYQNITSPIEFRFYAWGGTGGTYSINDFTFNGDVVLISSGGSEQYWLGDDLTRGGDGTWAAAGTAWSATDADGSPAVVPDKTKTLVFGGASSGTVTVSGTVEADKGLTFNTTGYVLSGGTAIEMNGADAATNAINVGTGVTTTIATDITGNTGVSKASAGTLIFIGGKSYTGGTTISAGTLQLGDGTTNGGLTGSVTNNAILAFNNGVDQIFANDISGTGALAKTGAGVLTLTGTNTSAGKTTITGGFIAVSDESKFGTSPVSFTADQITLNGGGIQSNGNVNFSSNRGITLGASGGTFNVVGTDVITLTNAVTGVGALTKMGSGVLNIDGANPFTGGLVINEGRVKLGNSGALNASSPNGVTFGAGVPSGTVLELNGHSVTVASLVSSGTPGSPVVENANASNATLTINNGSSNTFAGVIQDGTGGGTLALTKTSAGTLTLSGANTYTGGTAINSGTIIAGTNTALGTNAATVTNGNLFAAAGITVGNDINLSAVNSGKLLITQYYEGSSSNKWIEITNVGGMSIDLAAGLYRVATWSNSNTENYKSNGTPSTDSALSGTLGAGQSLLLRNGSADTPTYAVLGSVSNSTVNFSGNDSFVLYSGLFFSSGSIVDAIGFTELGNEGADKSFVRVTTSEGYNTTAASDVLDFSTVWTQFTIAAVDSAMPATEERLGYSSLSGGIAVPVMVGSNVAGTANFTGQVTLNNDASFTAALGSTVTFSGKVIGGSNNDLTKVGAGTVILSNATNDYAGVTTISAGNLQVGVAGVGAAGAGDVSVNGATSVISGTGTTQATTSVILGYIAPGDNGGSSTGTLTTNHLVFTPASASKVAELQITDFSNADKIVVNGDFTLNSDSQIVVPNGYTAVLGDMFTLIDWMGPVTLNGFSTGTNMRDGSGDTGTSLDLPDISSSGYVWDISDMIAGGSLTITVVVVPEPSRVLLAFGGVAALMLRRRR